MSSPVDNYITKQESPQKEICRELKALILKTLPGAREEMKWGVPTFCNGKSYIVALTDYLTFGFSVKRLSKKEVALFWERDYDAESNFWVKEDYFTTVRNNGNFHRQNHGWDTIYAINKRFSEGDNWQGVSNAKNEFRDFNIKVYDKVAWAVYYLDLTWEYKGEPFNQTTSRVTFLEKVDGNWKMALNVKTILNPCKTDND